ncbi:uncharacterized protein [Notamacropus eugenii]|uniref:uncharacterized protein n=1 Tax=Notamacropus eugenii TaxID=9315 RepID=UPI003B679517
MKPVETEETHGSSYAEKMDSTPCDFVFSALPLLPQATLRKVGILLDLPTHTGPAGRGKWRPDVGLEVRTSARRTNIERRFVATPSFSSLMKSPCVLEMTILAFLLLLHGSHGGFQSPDPEALSRTLFGSPCDCGGGTVTARPKTYTRMIDCTDRTAYLAYRHTATGISKQTWKCIEASLKSPINIHYHRLASLGDPADNEEDGLQFSKLVQSESRCMQWWKAFREKRRAAAVRKPMTGILRPHASGR